MFGKKVSSQMLTSDQIVAQVLKKKPTIEKGAVTLPRDVEKSPLPNINRGTGISVNQGEALFIESMESETSSDYGDKEDKYLWNYGEYLPKQKSSMRHKPPLVIQP